MFKQIFTLVKGKDYEASQAALDANALAILRQQMHEGAQGLEAARRAASLAIAQHAQEAYQLGQMSERINLFEQRAIEAIQHNRLDLAGETAAAIAQIEMERDAACQAQSQFTFEIEKMKATIQEGELRLRELETGQRLAGADKTRMRLRNTGQPNGGGALVQAEQTFARLRNQQTLEDVAETALADLHIAWCEEGLEERLIEACSGKETVSRTDQIMARLQVAAQMNASN